MKKKISLIAAMLLSLLLLSCKQEKVDRYTLTYNEGNPPTILEGVTFIKVPTSTFTLNETPDGREIAGAKTNKHYCIQTEFWISSEPVPTNRLFPMALLRKGVSYDMVNQKLDEIYERHGIPFVLPTEAMYEAALKSGAINPVKTEEAILGDGWTETDESLQCLVTNWKQEKSGRDVVLRKPAERKPTESYRKRAYNRIYLALITGARPDEELLAGLDYTASINDREESDGKKESIQINGVTFNMLPVKGGTAVLGSTSPQEQYAEEDERPAREVGVGDFKLSKTEITVDQWKAVMGYLPYGNSSAAPRFPVVNVSWYDAQRFVQTLAGLTGRRFRLPDEDEWEYAARGGDKTHDYLYSGGNYSPDVAVCSIKDKKRPRAVAVMSKKPNELGLYDMSGNVWEWVRGEHPNGDAVLRGGSRLSLNTACRVSNRQQMTPLARKDTFGFRIAL